MLIQEFLRRFACFTILVAKRLFRNLVKLVIQLASKGKGMCPFPKPGQLAEIAIAHGLEPDEEWEDEGWTLEKMERSLERRWRDIQKHLPNQILTGSDPQTAREATGTAWVGMRQAAALPVGDDSAVETENL